LPFWFKILSRGLLTAFETCFARTQSRPIESLVTQPLAEPGTQQSPTSLDEVFADCDCGTGF